MNEKLTIFYTDDDIDDLEFFKTVVNMITEDYTVVTHMDGKQLLHALENPPPHPHLLFLDINMPGMSGIEILQQVRNSEKHAGLPIIMFSTTQDEHIIRQTQELGANYYVPKAESFKQLRKSIQHTLQINWRDFIADQTNYLYNFN
ncbi:response regulator [Algoriphagus sp. NG3]|uniref:response regulator n=1 Tax=unclassified Algoriphagus TaxID=2641541 RepID=UPI002A828E6A|nr:response regulator [Algoriphagus sp. NG3]WPR74147.1 response regulator [Algoriphagus sp. NG3]